MIKQWSKVEIALRLALVCVWTGAGVSYQGTHPVVSAAPGVTETYIPLGNARIRHSAPAAADFNGDGYKEIIAGGSDGMLYVVSYNGTSWSKVWSRQTANDLNAANPPQPTSTTAIESAPAIADLDNDGHLEIVVTVGGDISQHLNGGVLVYRYNSAWNFTVASGWPQPRTDGGGEAGDPDGYWDGIWGSAALGDLDGDGDLEIVWVGFDRRIHAYHHNGIPVNSWPIYRYGPDRDNLLRGGWSSPALGDIDGDRLPEVIVATDSPPWDRHSAPDYSKGTVWAINGDSSNVPGWPVTTDNDIQSSPALGDIDRDGQLEVIVGSGPSVTGGNGHKVYAWNGDGSVANGWPKTTAGDMPASPALADLNGDGSPEVIIGCGTESDQSCTYLYAWYGDGTTVPGFPMQPLDANPWPGSHQPRAQPYPPIVADIDGDSHPEILMVMSSSGGVSIVEHNGAMSLDYSRFQDHGNDVIIAPPLVDDVDKDGLLETVVAGKGDSNQAAIYIWNETATISAQRPWPMFHHDIRRTGRYQLPPKLGFPTEVRLFHQWASGETETGYQVVRNEGEGSFDWRITNMLTNVRVSPSSSVVTTTASTQFVITTTGLLTGWHTLGTVSITGTASGKDVLGSPTTSTVYVYVGDVARVYLPLVLRNY
jgi:hypothetical protein